MINPAVFTTTFLAAAVEITEMVIIVVGVGAVRGWRSTLLGTGAGLAVVAALILALGTALTHVPINALTALTALDYTRRRSANRSTRTARNGPMTVTERSDQNPPLRRPGLDRRRDCHSQQRHLAAGR
jgi:hypothetical protein